MGVCLFVSTSRGRKKRCLCRCALRGHRVPELLRQCVQLPLQRPHTLCVHIWVGTYAAMSAPRPCPSAHLGVRPRQLPARVRVCVTACFQGWHGHLCPCNTAWASPTRAAATHVQHRAGSQVCAPGVPRPRGHRVMNGVEGWPCTAVLQPPYNARGAVHPRLWVPYAPSHGCPAAAELVPGTAKVNCAGARRQRGEALI